MPQARNGPAPEQGGGRLKSPPTGRYVHGATMTVLKQQRHVDVLVP
jgi:hypothetical protein